jgi:glycosyltransferase involved in cell wall biosynthesis
MRILLLLNARFPTEKAYGIQTITMAEGYAALGHQVAIAYPRRTREIPAPIAGVEFLPFGRLRTLIFPWLFHPFRFLGIFQAIGPLRNFRPDLVIANDPVQTAVLSKWFRVVWELHDLPNMHRWSRRVLLKRILKNVRGIVSTNQLKLDALKELGKLPLHIVVPNAVTLDLERYRGMSRDASRQALGISLQEKIIVYAGQLFDWKGVDTLIESAAFLPSDHVIHIVGGSGQDLERCKRLAAHLPSPSAKIVFHGLRPKEEIPTWLRAATLVVIPNSGRFEVSIRDTSPLKLFEALAAGAAIVASDLPSIREVMEEGGAVAFTPPDDPQTLAKTINRLTADVSHIETMRQAAELFFVRTGKIRAQEIATFFS